jgi:hypothetical protein
MTGKNLEPQAVDGGIVHRYRLDDETGQPVVWLPVPSELGRLFAEQIERDVQGMREAIEHRGGVVAQQDVYAPLRYIQQGIELLGEYQRVLKRAATDIKRLMEEVAADGVGADDDGKPVAPMTVPDRDGDISIRPEFKNTYTITPEQVLPAFASMFADAHADAVINQVIESASPVNGDCLNGVRAKVGALLAEAITDALAAVDQLGKFELQVTKVRAYRDHLAREGHDNAASIVDKAIHKARDYSGLKVERRK